MAETFNRKPIPGGDLDAWAVYNDTEHLRSYGLNSAYLYNSGGALTLSPGQFGIDNGTVKGTISVTADYSFSIVGLTNDTWAKIEVSVAGAAATLAIASIAGETDEAVIPSTVKVAYDGVKAGYYLVATKRLLGLVFIKTATVGRIVNCENGKLGFQNIECIDYLSSAGVISKTYIAKKIIEIGDWNMATTPNVTVNHNVKFSAVGLKRIRSINVVIRIDTDAAIMKINRMSDAADPKLLWGGVEYADTTKIGLIVRTGSDFDAVAFQTTSFNRGYITLEWET